jgi:uncharacterized membrane protein
MLITRARESRPAPTRPRRSADVRLARALGWFGVGLGAAEVAAPGAVAALAGLADGRRTLRAFGLRGIASGAGIIGRPAAAWVWARVAGDVLDLGVFGRALAGARGTRRRRALVATAAVAGVTAVDVMCALRLSRGVRPRARAPVRVRKRILVNRPAADLYGFWRELGNLPRFMKHVETVQPSGDGRSHWVVRVPFGGMLEWDAKIREDRPNELIAWRSLEGARVWNAGAVRFTPAPGGRGTVVMVEMQYRPPAGVAGALVATLVGREPGQQLQEDLRRFKQLVETGEIANAESPSARSAEGAR